MSTATTNQKTIVPPPQPNVITSEDLKGPSSSLNLPDAIPDTSASSFIDSVQQENKNSIDMQAEKAKAERESSTSDITKLMSDVGIIEGKKNQYENEFGVDTIQKNIDDIQSQIDIESNAVRNTVDNFYKNPNLTASLVSRLATEEQRKSASYIADLSIAKSIYSRDYDRAIGRAEKKVEMELAPVKAELDAKKFVFDANKDFWSESEKAQLNNVIAKEERAYNEQKEKATALEKQKVELFKNGAPETLLSSVREAKTLEDIYKIPGISTYLVSKADRLDMQLKGLQIEKAKNDLSPSSKIISLDDAIKYGVPPGTSEAEAFKLLEGNQEKQQELVRSSLQDKILSIGAISTHKGLNSRVGANILSRGVTGKAIAGGAVGAVAGSAAGGIGAIPGAIGGTVIGAGIGFGDSFSGAGKDFAASVHQLTNQETLDTLINAKAKGATFGALSEGELNLLKSAASKINDWEVKDKSGKGKGYWNIDEKSFNQELETLKTLSEKALAAAGGPVKTEEEIQNEFFGLVDNALVNTSNVYLDAGYDTK